MKEYFAGKGLMTPLTSGDQAYLIDTFEIFWIRKG